MDKTKLKKVYLDNCAWCHLHEREEPEIPKILKEIFDVIYSEVNLCEIEKITDKRLLCGRAEIVEDSLRHIRLLKKPEETCEEEILAFHINCIDYPNYFNDGRAQAFAETLDNLKEGQFCMDEFSIIRTELRVEGDEWR